MESVTIPDIIRLVSNISVLLPLVLYGTKIRQLSKPIQIIGLLIIVSAVSDAVGYYLSTTQQSTITLFNSYYLVSFVILSWFFLQILSTRKQKNVALTLMGIYALSFIVITSTIQPYTEYQTLLWVLVGIVMIVCSIMYLLSSFSELRFEPANESLIFVNSGILIYFILNLFLFIMGNYVLLKMDKELSVMIWSFHNVNNVIKNLLFAVGIYTFEKGTVLHHDRTSEALASKHFESRN